MRYLNLWVGAFTTLILVMVGGLIPASILVPSTDLERSIYSLDTSWQVPAVLLSSLVCGANSGVIGITSYLIIGLFYLPVFHGGGSIGYLLTPDFGYLLGFIPAIWVSAFYCEKLELNNLIGLTLSSFFGLCSIHIVGIINLVVGTIMSRWSYNLIELILNYSLSPISRQMIMCPCIALLALSIRKILFIR